MTNIISLYELKFVDIVVFIMSWQVKIAYTDNLISTGKIDKAAIYSNQGDSLWAQSNNFQLAGPEINELIQGFTNPVNLQSNGLHLQGVKFFLIRADDRSIYGKHAEEGVVAVKTKQTVLIGHYPAGVQAGEATTIVEKLADYLISVGY
ncbi:hypothetical protein WICMUC_003370 [Wickerhamomyces mucosus]|uniref:Profilin n=1 Tax=Wickerhamomyces mucosus TaxID=1378264 RepID=A0A9P8TD46_9ASCO|nr:hypothetical protein WICMUC_003370 [Wickerhamomyces mucosus]